MIDLWMCLLLVTGYFLYLGWRKSTRDVTLPPGPPTEPFLGNLRMNSTNLLETFQSYRQKYGDIFSLIMGARTMIVVNGAETLKEVFINNADVVSERPDTFATKFIGKYKGISNASGSRWKEQRTFAVGSLREFGFGKRSLESRIQEEVEVLVENIVKTNGEPFDIKALLTVSVSNIICTINFGKRFEYTDQFFLSIIEKIQKMFKNANIILLANFLPFVKYIPCDPFGIQRVLKSVEEVQDTLQKVVEEHEATFDENNMRDYIDLFLKKKKSEKANPNSTFDSLQLLRTVVDVFVAGTETTSTTLRWFILLMIRNQEVQTKMREEIIEFIGSSRYPNMDDKPKLRYTEAVIHETLRYGCIGPLALQHGLTKDLYIGGYKIPKDAILVPNLHSVLHGPDVFEDPGEFRPSRFLDADGNLVNLEKVMAFSLGRRICMGEALARMELFLFATTLIQRFQLLPTDAEHMPSTKSILGVTLAPVDFTFRAVCM